MSAVVAHKLAPLQAAISAMPQIEEGKHYLTEHFFADGMYARVVPRLAGVTLVGRVHKREHFYIVTTGCVAVTDGENEPKVYEAGSVIVSRPGTKRAVYAIVDSICMTVHRTDKTDPAELDEELVEPDETAMFGPGNKLKTPALAKDEVIE